MTTPIEEKQQNISAPVDFNKLAEALKYVLFDLDSSARNDFENSNSDRQYSSLNAIDWSNKDQVSRLKNAIENAFRKLKFPFKSKLPGEVSSYNLDNADSEIASQLKPGHVIVFESGSNIHYYLVTSYDDGEFATYPRLNDSDKPLFEGLKNNIGGVKTLKPNHSIIPESSVAEIKKIARELFPSIDVADNNINRQEFKFNDYTAYSNTLLQIGDTICMVDPSQLSFSTNNGYQYFPTLRTQGNPKIPTMQQVKNINVTIIFPNQDAVNFQLLNIFAMFRRTPFVNIRNIDIIEFFKEISVDDKYVSVALESIQIQSVEGFPNTLQAQLSLLPFDPRVVSTGFRALKSMGDVIAQQAVMYKDRQLQHLIEQSDRLLKENNVISSRFYDLVTPTINKTANFRESVPFRAFYQALIKERDYVKDEFGNDAQTNQNNRIDLSPFKPTKEENYLHHYSDYANQIPISFRYRYFDGDFTDVASLLVKQRSSQQIEKITQLKEIMETLKSPEELLRTMMSTFYDTSEFYKQYNNEFNKLNNVVGEYLSRHAIEVESAPGKNIKNIFDFMFRNNDILGVEQLFNGTKQAIEAVNTAGSQLSNSNDVIGEMSRMIWEESPDDLMNTGSGYKPVKSAIEGIWNWIESAPGSVDNPKSRKGKFVAFLNDIGNKMRDEIGSNVSTLDDNKLRKDRSEYGVFFNAASEDFDVTRIPLKEETIVIDNVNDVITGWSLQFSNKFTPIHIAAYKYPYYQHMGSDDVSVSLNITSASRGIDLKSKLSRMSDRLYDSIKIVQLTAPELTTYVDPRIFISGPNGGPLPAGNIFRVFGVDSVVYNSSNSSNIQGQPDSWNTLLNLTQANFTIKDYHSIESVESSTPLRDEMAKLLMKMVQLSDKSVRVYKYKMLNFDKFPENIKSIMSSSSKEDSELVKNYINERKDSLEYSEITDIDYLGKLAYIFSSNAEELSLRLESVKLAIHVKDVNEFADAELQKKKAPLIKKIADKTNQISKIEKRLNSYTNTKYKNRDTIDLARFKNDLEKLKLELESIDKIYNASRTGGVASDRFEKDVTSALNGIIYREIDKSATNKLNSLMSEYPNFSKIISYNLRLIDEIYKNQTKGMISLINRNESFWKTFLNEVNNTIAGNNNKAVSVGIGIVLSAALGLIPITAVAGSVAAIFSITTALTAVNAAGVAGKEKALDTIKGQFATFFEAIIQNIRQSTITDLASKIIKDPVIYQKFLSLGVFPTAAEDLVRQSLYKSITNCYNDFDFRLFAFPNTNKIDFNYRIRLSPDFYLYNYLIGDEKVMDYVDEAISRYVSINKLTTLTGLTETAEILKQFKDLEETIGNNKDADIIYNGVREQVYRKSTYEDTLAEILEWYKQSVFMDLTWADSGAQNLQSQGISDAKMTELLTEFDKFNPFPEGVGGIPFYEGKGTPQQRQWREKKAQYTALLKSKVNSSTAIDKDKFYANVIYAARIKALIELYQMYKAINDYLVSSVVTGSTTNDKNDNSKKVKAQSELEKKLKLVQNKTTLDDVYQDIKVILQNADKDFTKDPGLSDFVNKRLTPNLSKGGQVNVERKVSVPDAIMVKNLLYDKIANYIRLNAAVNMLNSNTVRAADVINSLPDLRFLQYWGTREKEASVKRLETLNDFLSSYNKKRDTTIRMFPTFKIYFIEEDKGIYNQLDDYYTYNALQSVEVTSNKNSASQVARVRLTNITGALTDRMSLMREKSDFMFSSSPIQNDNVFFGTLDVKPGTSIMIKLGYAANDADLPIVFMGRIIEMNPGPEVEIIAQSYSAQLNHPILHEKFGMLGTVKAHGDVASAVLDLIPGLEKMGKADPYSIATGFSGRNMRNFKGNFADRFLLSNALGSISALAFAQDNPRDDNIYLPYDLVDTAMHKPTFNWVVYNQSVWDVLHELSLHNKNTRPVIRCYNDDPLSTKDDARQTIVVGDKSGYYKYTDSFSLSGKDYQYIDNLVDEYIRLLIKLKEKGLSASVAMDPFLISKTQAMTQPGIVDAASLYDGPLGNVIEAWTNDSFYSDMYKLMADKNGSLVIATHMLRNIQFNKSSSVFNDLVAMLMPKLDGFGKHSETLGKIFEMSSSANPSDVNNFSNISVTKFSIFSSALKALFKANLPTDVVKEDFYIINPIIDNTEESLIYKPNYKKIQTHHLISDTTDIISNNISLSSNFKNAVNLYYPNEPILADVDGLNAKQLEHLNVWRIKAFGDTRDEHVRPLNSFQKNIDTNWYEVNRQIEGFFKGYKKIYDKDGGKDVKNYVGGNQSNFNLKNISTDVLPAFWTVGVNLLQKEVEKMYQGTLEIVGDPSIKPYDIIHINDDINDMQGTVEVEEVTHVFTPDLGYRTMITPNLMTYDRNPSSLQDVSVIGNIYDFAKTARNTEMGINIIGGAALAAISIPTLFSPATSVGIVGGIAAGSMLWNGAIGVESKYRRFLYDQFAQVMGRDCVNFTTLIYHNQPMIAGFDGIDYTSLTTLINYKVKEMSNGSPIARLAAFTDPFAAVVSTNWNPEQFGLVGVAQNYGSSALTNGIPFITRTLPNSFGNFNSTPFDLQ